MSNNQIIMYNEIIQDYDKKEEKKRFEFIPFECINYSKFDEMKRKLESFYSELHKSITDNIKIENENVKKSVYTSLEKLLTEISLIKEEKLKILKIDEVFKWFKRKLSSFDDIKIDFKAARKNIKKFSVPDSYKKPDNNDAEKVLKTLNLDNKRTLEAIESPNKKIKQLQAKKIVPIKLKVNENIKNNRFTNFFKTNEISFQIIIEDLVSTENESGDMFNEDSIFYMFAAEHENTKNRKPSAAKLNQFRMTNLTNNFINNNNRNTQNNGFSDNYSSKFLNDEIQNLNKNKANQINPKRFLSTGQLITDINNLNDSGKNRTSIISSSKQKNKESIILHNKKISEFKNDENIEKRNYEEMKEFLNIYDKNESIFKKEMEKKHELKNMLNFHEKNFMENKDQLSNNNIINLDALTFKKTILPDPIKHKSNQSISLESYLSNYNNFFISSTDNFCITCTAKIKKKPEIKVNPNLSLKNEIRKANKNFHNYKRLNFNNIKNFQNKDFEDGNKKNFKMLNYTIGHNLIKINIRFSEDDMLKSKLTKNPKVIKPIDSNSIITTTYDKSFGSPNKFTKLSQISEINYKTDEINAEDNNTLSIYGEFNMAISVSPFADYNNTQRNATGFDFTYKNSENCENENFNFNSFANNKNNFLMQRKTVSFNQKGFFNNFNGQHLANKQKSRRINFNFSHDAIKKSFLPPAEDKIYPKYFLPEPGYGLITKAKFSKEEKNKIKDYKLQS